MMKFFIRVQFSGPHIRPQLERIFGKLPHDLEIHQAVDGYVVSRPRHVPRASIWSPILRLASVNGKVDWFIVAIWCFGIVGCASAVLYEWSRR